MDWQLFRNQIVNQYYERPQLVARLDLALGHIRAGLEELARAGHTFHLEGGPGELPSPWPRLVYHFEKAPRGHLCLCPEDFELLGGALGGWHDTLDEAKQSAGMDKQFTRGGVFPKSGLPAIQVNEAELSVLDRLRKAGLQ